MPLLSSEVSPGALASMEVASETENYHVYFLKHDPRLNKLENSKMFYEFILMSSKIFKLGFFFSFS